MADADILGLVGNDVTFPADGGFCAILGATPSQGARSPLLWNAAFDAHGALERMVPLDVTSEHLVLLLDVLDADQRFLGGAVAVPHKVAVCEWLGARATTAAARSGAVNALHRGPDGRIAGSNTDGEAAIGTLCDRAGDLAGRVVLVLGAGGVAAAVVAAIRDATPSTSVVVAARDTGRAGRFAAMGATVVPWGAVPEHLGRVDVLVNCTTVGSASGGANGSPLSAPEVAALGEHVVVFDVIYDPSPTALLRAASDRGLAAVDGKAMNLEQAIVAFGRVGIDPRGPDATRTAMESVAWG